ncbi:MAG: YfcC family protein [Bacteroidales bacterium]|nr:YfcC family protein [Bacteroidales bacterium]
MAQKKVPHTFVIVFFIIVIAAVMTWMVKPGYYIKENVIENGVEVTSMNFYYQDQLPEQYCNDYQSEPQTWQIFSALFKGFEKQSSIIVFILIIGGAFWIMNKSHAIDMGIFSFLRFTRRLENIKLFKTLGVDNIIITLIMLLFSLFGAVFGMSEECIAFIIIIIPLAISMGYDSIVGVCMVYVAAHVGFAGAILNPFTIGIAQGIAEVPLFSGIGYRVFCWVVINVITIAFVLLYAKKVKKNPMSSIMYDEDAYWRTHSVEGQQEHEAIKTRQSWYVYAVLLIAMTIFSFCYPTTTLNVGNSSMTAPFIPILTAFFALLGPLSLRKTVHNFILLILLYTIIYLIVGVMGYGWYVMEIATLFLVMGIASGLAIGKTASDIARLFIEGMSDILSAAVVVGLAGGIVIILQEGGIIDTILYGLSKSMTDLGKIASVEIMYAIQTIVNVVIPSGSAKAAITMPIMAPFSDLIGVCRQATVMAFQFGDGFTNMITPTSGVLIAALGVARVPYQKWFKWAWKFILLMIILGGLLLIPTVTMPLEGF